ncbi:MAG TPA: PhnD/SsuA/transferrin family substrate-binding protein [Ktedonobacteraceae bacterium]
MNDTTLLFATYLASADYKMYQHVTEYIEKFTGIPSILLNGEALDDFSLGFIDAGFIAASDYAYLANQAPSPVERIAIPVLSNAVPDCERAMSKKCKLKIMVRKESPCYEIADLQECIFSYCSRGYTEDEEAIYQSIERILRAGNVCPLTNLFKMVETCSYMQALRMVLHGEADAAIIEASVLDLVLRNSSSLTEGLRELGTYNVSREADVVISVRLDARIKQGLREAFRTIHQEPFFAQRLQEGSIEQFLVIEPESIPLESPSVSSLLNSDHERVDVGIYDLEHAYAYSL